MVRIAVASTNPIKVNSVKLAFSSIFPDLNFNISGFSVSSGVSAQPIGEKETLKGATNRVKNLAKTTVADYYVGIEGGSKHVGKSMETFAWIVVKSKNKISKSRTASFYLPKKIIALIKQGVELGQADDIVFNRKNSKQLNGAIGILTNDVVTRTDYYQQAVVLAFIPFKNPKLY